MSAQSSGFARFAHKYDRDFLVAGLRKTLDARDENGNLKKVKVKEKDFDRWVAEGKMQQIGDGCQAHILDPKGDRTENWIVGQDVPQDVYDRMKDAKGDLYVLVVHRRGEPEVNVVPKEIWEQAAQHFADMDRETSTAFEKAKRDLGMK